MRLFIMAGFLFFFRDNSKLGMYFIDDGVFN